MSNVPDPAVNQLELLVFSGEYENAIALSAQGYSERDTPLVIGALALGGRLDEAESAFLHFSAHTSLADGVAQGRFFLIAGLCHAGKATRALLKAREGLAEVRRAPAAVRFWACQALALVRYFEGRYRQARRFARRALDAAVQAGFAYGRFLALDLLAHLSVQTGEIYAGLRLLAQAEALARALGYEANAATERTTALVLELRFSLTDFANARARVEEMVNAPSGSYFTRRGGLIELAVTFALRGERARASSALDAARRIALAGADNRATARWLVCHALCTALAAGPEHARPSLEQARAQAADQITLLSEVGFVELVFLGERCATKIAEYRKLAERSGVQRLQIACDVALGHQSSYPPRVEDGLGRLLLECTALAPAERARRVVGAGLLGLLPWALERAPARRILLGESALLTENHGEVAARDLPLRPSQKLLLALRHGYKSRAELLHDVWGITRFVPSRHTPTLHTAVSRLRVALAEPDWLITHEDGYALQEGVEVVTWEAKVEVSSASELPAPPGERERVLEFVEQNGAVSSAEVARGLKLSASSALRILRSLAEEGLLARRGGGRSTRYARA